MAQIINLRQARKQKERAAASAKNTQAAAQNGRSKALKSLEKARADKAVRDLDGKRRDGPAGFD